MNNIFENFLKTELSPEVFSSLIVIGIIAILAIIIGIMARKADPLKKPKGLLFLAETGVNFFDRQVSEMMGFKFEGFGGYIMAIAVYLFIGFIFGLTGLPSPVTNLAIPFSLGIFTFTLIHYTAVRHQKWSYFKRYVEPVPVFLPVNLISMWAPLLSLTFRLFGNAISGWVLMSIVYSALENLSGMIFSFIPSEFNQAILAPFITPILHAYFDLFSGFIQTTVFIFLTMIFISNEASEDEVMEQAINLSKKGEKNI